MFERFSEKAKKVIIYAKEEAQKRKHEYVDTGHLLLALLKEENELSALILMNMEVSIENLLTEIDKNLPIGSYIHTFGDLPFSPQAKRVLELAVEEAKLSGKANNVSSEHLLLGLIKEDEGIAGKILRSHGANLQKIREIIINES